MPTFSIKESPNDGGDSCTLTEKPSPIFIFAKVNHFPMNVMFDSGATTSLINKTTLTSTHHLPIKLKKINYMMADGHTTMEIIGTVNIFIELNNSSLNLVSLTSHHTQVINSRKILRIQFYCSLKAVNSLFLIFNCP